MLSRKAGICPAISRIKQESGWGEGSEQSTTLAESGVQAGDKGSASWPHLQLSETRSKGEGTGPLGPGLQVGRRVGEERDSRLQPSFSWSGRQPPARPRQGHNDSFPFQLGKPPPCRHPHPGLWGLEEETWSPQGQPSHLTVLPISSSSHPGQDPGSTPSLGLVWPCGLGQGKKALQLLAGDMCRSLVWTDAPRTPGIWVLGHGVLEGQR